MLCSTWNVLVFTARCRRPTPASKIYVHVASTPIVHLAKVSVPQTTSERYHGLQCNHLKATYPRGPETSARRISLPSRPRSLAHRRSEQSPPGRRRGRIPAAHPSKSVRAGLPPDTRHPTKIFLPYPPTPKLFFLPDRRERVVLKSLPLLVPGQQFFEIFCPQFLSS